MKIITTQTKKVFSPEYGWLQQTRRFVFGIPLWPINSHWPIPDNLEEKALCQIIAERQVSYSEMTANLPDLSNSQFDKFQNEMAEQIKSR